MPKRKSRTAPEAIIPEQESSTLPAAISASLLRVAVSLEERGMTHQALPPYLKLIERYPNSQEASTAVEKVLAIAEGLRKIGQPHVAMTVLSRLETARQGQ